jgi:hypothetical protein
MCVMVVAAVVAGDGEGDNVRIDSSVVNFLTLRPPRYSSVTHGHIPCHASFTPESCSP